MVQNLVKADTQSAESVAPGAARPAGERRSQGIVASRTCRIDSPTGAGNGSEPDRLWGMAALEAKRYQQCVHQAKIAGQRERWVERNAYYYESVARLLRFIIEPGARVLNVRSQLGQFLAMVAPAAGVGLEISEEMVEAARRRHPEFESRCIADDDFELDRTFDYILVNDVSDMVDVLETLRQVRRMCRRETRVVVYSYNYLWQPLLSLASRLGLRVPTLEPGWFSEQDLRGLLHLADLEVLKTHRTILVPKWIPFVSEFINRVVARLPIIRNLCMVEMLVARPVTPAIPADQVSVSVIIPCKNERENVQPAVERIPAMGKHVEIIFCDDRSTDGTAEEVHRLQAVYPEKDIRLVAGPGISKAQNVWTGFREARGDVLMILDGDLAVMPEELPRFFDALVTGKGEMINGSRLVYRMQQQAMKYSNYVGNWLFARAFSYLLEQPIKDTLCGTKVFWRRDWKRIEALADSWGVEDKWGDFAMLFGAARRHLKVIDLPIHYQDRIYGVTKMTRVFSNGFRMLRMCLAAFRKLKMGY
jgi:SAM-dependent methyltransferase